MSSLLSANCWVVLPEEGSSLLAGSRVQIFRWIIHFEREFCHDLDRSSIIWIFSKIQ
ncbi:MAG: hypothetical protein IPL83_06190 [Bdellovibrionales bacterium]|nr:hypothetical protein [Bdellovibrionales bacterium]